MEDLFIKRTKESPEIHFSKAKNIFKIDGRSLVENVHDFFVPIQEWITNYVQSPNANTTLEINLEYFNSGTLKQLFQLIYTLEDMNELGHSAKIIWYHKKGDELIYQKGLEFQRFLAISVDIVELT
jgi:hypothetical protein